MVAAVAAGEKLLHGRKATSRQHSEAGTAWDRLWEMVAGQGGHHGEQSGRNDYQSVSPGGGITKVRTAPDHPGDYLVSPG